MKPTDLLIDGYTRVRNWRNCPTPDCENKVCIWGGVGLCFPCSARVVGKHEMDKRYVETHDEDTPA